MRAGLRVVALFVVYSAIGFGGDYAFGLLAQDRDSVAADVRVRHVVESKVDVVVDVRPEIVVDLRFRRSGECTFSLDRSLTISARGVTRFNIDAGSGGLRVEGQQGLEEIEVVGVACASVEEWLDELLLTLHENRAGEVTLVTHYPERRRRGGRRNVAQIDLTVRVPLGLDVGIDDTSGEIEVVGVGSLWIDDSSGSIRVREINGNLTIDDSSGGLEIQDVSGDVEIEDGSGGIDIREVQGSVTLRDGSGGIAIVDVGHDVVIESDGSGGIDVRRIGGDFMVDRDGSGGIRHSDVGGLVDIPDDEHRRRRRRRRGGR